ncbi:MAG: protein tyrosine phosphatase family protein [Novosphingobium sp.]|nr:protein tyrosine phosphatase family protein [Novosphingobium sp.]
MSSSAPDPIDIPNWLRIDDLLTTSGQPGEEQLAALRAIGVKRVINLGLHTHERALQDEAASVAALGMDYVHIPVPFDAPGDDDFARFRAAMAAARGEAVHVHCIVNARVSAFVYRYRRDVLGVDEAKAREAMEKIWRPDGVWAAFIGDDAAAALPHGPARTAT